VCHRRKINANRNIFFFVTNNDPRRAERVYLIFDWHHLHRAETPMFSVFKGPELAVWVSWTKLRHLKVSPAIL
jgi:hypothetical protein